MISLSHGLFRSVSSVVENFAPLWRDCHRLDAQGLVRHANRRGWACLDRRAMTFTVRRRLLFVNHRPLREKPVRIVS